MARKKINTSKLIVETADELGFYRSQSKEVINTFLDLIFKYLDQGNEVALVRLGSFFVGGAKLPREDGEYRQTIKFRPAMTAKKNLSKE